jgi:hypothetical protein
LKYPKIHAPNLKQIEFKGGRFEKVELASDKLKSIRIRCTELILNTPNLTELTITSNANYQLHLLDHNLLDLRIRASNSNITIPENVVKLNRLTLYTDFDEKSSNKCWDQILKHIHHIGEFVVESCFLSEPELQSLQSLNKLSVLNNNFHLMKRLIMEPNAYSTIQVIRLFKSRIE